MTINGIESKNLIFEENKLPNTDIVFKTLGKRKRSIATLIGCRGQGKIYVNGKDLETYFQYDLTLLNKIKRPFKLLDIENEYDITLSVNGGGLNGQSEAIQLAISKAFASLSKENKIVLKKQKFLTRDSRIKERKKYGLKKARKASQFSKR